MQRWDPEGVGVLLLGGGNVPVPERTSIHAITCSSLAALDRLGRLLPSGSELISLFSCLFVPPVQQWWTRNQTGRARQPSPKTTPPLTQAMSPALISNPRQGPNHLLSLSRILSVLFQFFGFHQPASLAFVVTPR